MSRSKGNTRCEKCEGHGIVRGPRGYFVCECVRGKPNRKVLAELAAIELPDFEAYHDEYRQQHGLPPFEYKG